MTEAPLSPGYPASVVGGELRLPKPPGVVRQFWGRHPRLTDALIAALYFVPTLLGTLSFAFEPSGPFWLGLAQLGSVAASAAAMLYRRTRPWLLMGVGWFSCLVIYPLGSIDLFPVLVALYALAVYRSTRAAWVGFGASVVVGTASAYLSVAAQADDMVSPFDIGAPESATQYAIFMLIATLIGVTVGNRRRYLNALIARAHDLARERDQQALLATAVERSRIAREMHDVVAHSVTVMVTLAEGSAATAERDAARAGEAMRLVADTGRGALAEMRRMLGILAESESRDAARSPQPGTADLPELIEGFRGAGMPVRLTTIGRPDADPALELTIYRIVQEGLTNTLRHAAAASRVEVTIEYRGDATEVLVVDDGHAPSTTQVEGSGRGLIGMRERVALYSGSLEAGPRTGGGWRLRVVLPRDERAAIPTISEVDA
ncbi:sensor histidine kinase [Agromyces albus]|uniref:histidine kinase n=1 Tax=Agromyces albus TaxID=205332 RepID=A0A4Q2KZI1_9MICO|nr:histidine kinase [Agromyces albus]RXZ70447.1 two-component sensor histidine kinase [Agromyces albus]